MRLTLWARRPGVRWILALTVLHLALSIFAYEMRTGFSGEPVFWGLAGVSLAFISASPRSWRRGLTAGLVVSSATTYLVYGSPPLLAAGFAVANGAMALAAGSWLGRWLPQGRRIVRLQDIAWLIAGALIGGVVGSGLGGVAYWLAGEGLIFETVGYWFTANLAGVLVGGPAFLAIVSLKKEPPPHVRLLPVVVVAAVTAGTYASAVWASHLTGRNFMYLVILPLMVSAVWLGQRETAILVGGLALAVGVMTGSGLGPFAETESAFDPLIAGQAFMCVVQLTVLTVGVEASRRRDLIAELDGILEATLEAVLVVDETGVIRQANRGSEPILGASQSELIGTRLSAFIPADVFEAGDGDLCLTPARRLDGGEFWAEISRGRIREKSGRRRTAIVLRDVTQRIETEKRVRRMQDEFVSNMTHELRTPLTAIIGFSEWLMDDMDAATAATDLEIIHDSAVSMKMLIDEILDFKRITSSTVELGEVDLRNVVERTVNLVRPAAAKRSVTLSLKLEPCPPVMGDLDQLEHAVRNVVSNAVKYSDSGGVVSVNLMEQTGSVVLSVVDEGIGIPTADQARLFERFFRAGNVGEIHGTGLGLALVRQIVERHDGTVDLTSAVGRGTRVDIVLRLASESTHAHRRGGSTVAYNHLISLDADDPAPVTPLS